MTISDECEDQLARLSWARDVPSPMDADGRLVPLSTETLYTNDGERKTVEEIVFDGAWWYVKCLETTRLRLSRFHLYKPDSWESLEEDARKAPREYIEGRGITAGIDGRVAAMVGDIVRRAKALAGVSDRD